MNHLGNVNESTTFSAIKGSNNVFNKFKQDTDSDGSSDSTIIIEANCSNSSPKIKSNSKFTSTRTSVYDDSFMTSYPSTSKTGYSNHKFMDLDKPTTSSYKVNDYCFSNPQMDSEVESILLKYASPPSKATGTSRNCTVANAKKTSNNEKYDLIEINSDEDEYLPKPRINDINKTFSAAVDEESDAIIKELSQKYKCNLKEDDKHSNKSKIKNNKLCSSTFESNLLDYNEELSNEYTPILLGDDHLACTNFENNGSSTLRNVVDYQHLLENYNGKCSNNVINTGNSPYIHKSSKNKRKLNVEQINTKARKMEMQAKKKEEAETAKRLKQALLSANKNMKPEECMKFITVMVDSEMTNESYANDLLKALRAASIMYRLEPQLIPQTITWNRGEETHFIDTEQNFTTTSKSKETEEVLLILKWKEIVELVQNRSLVTHIKSLQSILGNKKLTLAIYGMENYFKYQKSQKQKEMRIEITGSSQRTNNKSDKIYKDSARINMKQLEFALTELQLLCRCCHRMVETSDDLGAMIVQFTKSIAQTPYKLEKQRKEQEAQWFMSGDNKDCVHVDKNGNGLQRLWQQQLTTFPLARLEHAEAIVAVYPTPTSLIEAYTFRTQTEGEKLLQDIPIRRAAGPLTTVRKIGPELSKKIFKFFTSTDGDVIL